MKTEYPQYDQGEIQEVKKRLFSKDKSIIEDFLKVCSITAGKSKIDKIERILLQFFDVTEKHLDNIKKEDVNGFLVLLKECDRSFWTKNEIKTYLKKFLLWYYKDLSLVEHIKRAKEDKKLINDKKINENTLMTQEEIELMVRNASNFRTKSMILILFESGCRPHELLNLKWKDIEFKDGYADMLVYSSKTNYTRIYPLKSSIDYLNKYKQEFCFPNVKREDYVFPNPFNRNKHISTPALLNNLKTIAKRAGIDKNVWSYLFRHSRATRLYEELPQQIVEKLMGHKNMAETYAHISTKKARDELLKKLGHIEEIPKSQKEIILKRVNRMETFLKEMLKSIENNPEMKVKDLKLKIGINNP